MNENEFRKRWQSEKAMYDAWGELVTVSISSSLSECLHVDLKSYLKIPVQHRLKDDDSLIDKAFYRNKGYQNPYDDIEDKVGVRFVVMLQEDAENVCSVIAEVATKLGWEAKQCRDYNAERKASPTLFTYQSHHFIIKNLTPIELENVNVPVNTPCEVQVRSLLQHAYAELTHDAIYKTKTIVEPEVIRTVAKTMAFIETADEFFQRVVNNIDSKDIIICEKVLDSMFIQLTGLEPIKQNSSIIILDTFKNLIKDNFEEEMIKFISRNKGLAEIIKRKASENKFYKQSVILFVYWLIRRNKSAVEAYWPLHWSIISDMAMDVGIALSRVT